MSDLLPKVPVVAGFEIVEAMLANSPREALVDFESMQTPDYRAVVDNAVSAMGISHLAPYERAFRAGSCSGFAAILLSKSFETKDFPVGSKSIVDVCDSKVMVSATELKENSWPDAYSTYRTMEKLSRIALTSHIEADKTAIRLNKYFGGRGTTARIGLGFSLSLLDAAWPTAVQNYYKNAWDAVVSENPSV